MALLPPCDLEDSTTEHPPSRPATANNANPSEPSIETPSQSRLLNLPAELRLEIYSYVIGQNFAHVLIEWKDPSGNSGADTFAYDLKPHLHLLKCRYGKRDVETENYNRCMYPTKGDPYEPPASASASTSMNSTVSTSSPAPAPNISPTDEPLVGTSSAGPIEDTIQTTSLIPPSSTTSQLEPERISAIFDGRHHKCYEPIHSQPFDLRFLRTCKSIYTDSRLLIYQLTTFSFRTPEVFDQFIYRSTPEYLANVRSLHFHLSFAHPFEEWTHAFEKDVMLSLSSLRRLFVWIDFDIRRGERTVEHMARDQSQIFYKRPIALFRMCPLRNVKLMLFDPETLPWETVQLRELVEGFERSGKGRLFGWEEMRGWSREMEERLLMKWEGPMDLLET